MSEFTVSEAPRRTATGLVLRGAQDQRPRGHLLRPGRDRRQPLHHAAALDARGNVFSDEVFWAAGDVGRKTLATNVIAAHRVHHRRPRKPGEDHVLRKALHRLTALDGRPQAPRRRAPRADRA